MRKGTIILLLCGLSLQAQDMKSRAKALFAASVATVSAATLADAGTSWGKAETNPILGQSRFGASQIGVKLGLVSAAMAGQYLLMRHSKAQLAKAFTAINFAGAGVLGAVAYHNSAIPRIPSGASLK